MVISRMDLPEECISEPGDQTEELFLAENYLKNRKYDSEGVKGKSSLRKKKKRKERERKIEIERRKYLKK